jgi:hypothetical protein
MFKKRILVLSVIGLLILAVSLATGLVFSASTSNENAISKPVVTNYGPEGNGQVTYKYKAEDIKEHSVSDEYALKRIEEIFGSDVASVMNGHRVTTSITRNDSRRYTVTPVNLSSSNWCGYYLLNSNVRSAWNYFNVVENTGSNADTAAWVGVGNPNVIQCGYDMELMEAWYELLPAAPNYVFDVYSGDQLMVSAGLNTDNGCQCVAIVDYTHYNWYYGEWSYSPEHTAEWIVEDVSGYHVGTFGTVSFSSCHWLDSSDTGHHINEAGTLYRVNLLNGFSETMYPSNLGGSGDSFSISH